MLFPLVVLVVILVHLVANVIRMQSLPILLSRMGKEQSRMHLPLFKGFCKDYKNNRNMLVAIVAGDYGHVMLKALGYVDKD